MSAELGVEELAPRGPEHQAPRQHPGPVERAAEGHHRRLRDHGLVEVEEGGDAGRVVGGGHTVEGSGGAGSTPLSASRRAVPYRRLDDPAAARSGPASPDAARRGSAAAAPIGGPMLVACWSSKGGAGTTVVAAALAVLLARRAPAAPLIADLAGDVPAALGLAEPDGPGLAGWLAAGADVPADALGRLEQPAGAGPRACCRGARAARRPSGPTCSPRSSPPTPRPVVADCGAEPDGAALAVAAGATRSLLVTRPCFLSLRRRWRVPAAALRGRAAHRARPRPQPRRRRGLRRRPGRRRGRGRPAGRPGGRRRPARHPPAPRLARELGRAA